MPASVLLVCAGVSGLVSTVSEQPVPARAHGPAPYAAARAAENDTDLGIQLLDAPTSHQGDPRAYAYVVDHLKPGQTIHRRIRVSNLSQRQLHAEIYPGAATIEDHKFKVSEGRSADELTTWIQVSRSRVDLDAGGNVTAVLTISVPARASTGERYAVLWAETASTVKPSANVAQVGRVGVRIYLDVGPGGDPPSGFEIVDMAARRAVDGQPSIVADVRNTGQRALDISGTLNLSGGPGSMSAGPFEVTKGTTLSVGDTGPISIVLDRRLPDGPWKAHLKLQSGFVIKEIDTTVTFPPPGGSDQSISMPSRPIWMPLGIGGIVVILTAAGVGVFVRRRRRTTRH